MRLADFILDNLEPILQSWEDFAKTIPNTSPQMDVDALRDHAEQMLRTIAEDLRTLQSTTEQIDKSVGKANKGHGKTAAETHAILRHPAPSCAMMRASASTKWSLSTVLCAPACCVSGCRK
ncbi:hypothetical protein [Stutzerimonas stutzeri]|uniref:hypothetical protein n=1 Tax=Stutzerimonas stutzeri TaxID=316 RepID=UPI00269F48D3